MSSFDKLSQNISDQLQPVATRRAAVIEIAEIGGEQALPLILNALTDEAPGVRREAANVLQRYNTPEVTTTLLDAIKIEDNDLTLWTFIEVLGNIGTMTALPVLQDLTNTTLSPLTRRVIEKSIDQITSRLPNNDVEERDTSDDLVVEKSKTSDIPFTSELQNKELDEDQETEDENIVEIVAEDQHLSIESDEDIDANIDSNQEEDIQHSKDIEISVVDVKNEEYQKTKETTSEETEENALPDEDSNTSCDRNTDSLNEESQDFAESDNTSTISGTSPSLPVLVPNTSVVVYEPEEQQFQPNIFAMVLRPTTYLSKRWVSRTRLYVVLLLLLAAATLILVYSQVERRPRSPYSPNAAIAYMENPKKYFDAGNFFIQQGDYNSAVETLEFIRGADSIDVEFYRNLGYAYFHTKQYALAAESFEYYLKLRKNKTYELFVAEAAYQQNGDDRFDDSSDYIMYNLLGTSYSRIGQYHKARRMFEQAINLAPTEPEAYNNLAQLYSDGYQQKLLLSEALATTAVSLKPDVPSYQDTLGWIYIKNGRLHKGINTIKQALRLQSDFVPAHYHLTEIAQNSKITDDSINLVKRDLIDKLRPTSKSNSEMISVLSYIYETKAQNIPRFNTSILYHRGVRRK